MRMRSQVDFSNPESILKFPWKIFLAIGIGVPLVFLVLGVYLLFQHYERQETWVDVPAVVTFSDVSRTRDSDGDIMYKPVVEYEYEYDGQSYPGNMNLSSSSSRASAESTSREYIEEKEIVVKVNPEEPAESVGDDTDQFMGYAFAGMGAALLLIFGGVGTYGIRKKRRIEELLAQGQRIEDITL